MVLNQKINDLLVYSSEIGIIKQKIALSVENNTGEVDTLKAQEAELSNQISDLLFDTKHLITDGGAFRKIDKLAKTNEILFMYKFRLDDANSKGLHEVIKKGIYNLVVLHQKEYDRVYGELKDIFNL